MISSIRLNNELKKINTGGYESMFKVSIVNENIFDWIIEINGPHSTLYAGYKFAISVKIGKNYPSDPPSVKCITKIKHLNINEFGDICLDILKTDGWSSTKTIVSIATSIISLLADPNPDDPLDSDLCHIYRSSPEVYRDIIIESCNSNAEKLD